MATPTHTNPCLRGKKILLGVTGGIAAYKSADLLRRLRDAEADVRVVMTPAATRFISPLTFQALSSYPVLVDWDQQDSDSSMDHIAWARWADLILIAPASADFMAKLAHGLADDVLSALCLAAEIPIMLAPAMNQRMWRHPATVANAGILMQRELRFIGPDSGSQACGEVGPGRMVEPSDLVEAITDFFNSDRSKLGLKVVITAGPTREAIDPVRFISNRSTGKMGYALAEVAAAAGADVWLISGPTDLPCPHHLKRIEVETAAQMHAQVMTQVSGADIFIAVAAVSDYCLNPALQKIKKTSEQLELVLQKNVDTLASVAALKPPPFTVGFAAETEHLEKHAKAKLHDKHIDMIAANIVAQTQGGFSSDDNALLVLWKDGQKEFSLRPKRQLARDLWQLILTRYRASHGI